MRAVIQRVSQASVEINGEIVGSIQYGMLVLVGIEGTDEQSDAEWLSTKLCSLRIFNDDEGKMNKSIDEIDGEFLVVSQFTLHAKYKKGSRPSYIKAARPEKAIPLYESFIKQLEAASKTVVQTGTFGAMMHVHLTNDGPVTIIIDTKNKE